jgi:hypothetical protein
MSIRTVSRHPVTWVVAALLAVVLAIALYLFQPWRLFTTVEVDEALPGPAATAPAPGDPTPSPARRPKVLASGAFVSHEHATSGKARVLRLGDGSRVLRIEDLDTSDGPDLRVWLTDQAVTPDGWRVFDDGRWLELGTLKGNRGNANYQIPKSADLGKFTSVTIWCKRFSVSFGAASLTTGT